VYASAASIALDSNEYRNSYSTFAEQRQEVAPLPTPPSGPGLSSILPYLFQLAMAEKQMSWRVGVAFICMLTSKAAGLCAADMWSAVGLVLLMCA
jgi:hypothetical protein